MSTLVEVGSSVVINPIFCLATNETNRVCAAGRSGQKNGFFTIYSLNNDTKLQALNKDQPKDDKNRGTSSQLSFKSIIHREIDSIASKTICWLKYSENNYSNLIAYGGSNGDVSLWDITSQEQLTCRSNIHCSKTVIHQLLQRPNQFHQLIAGDSLGSVSVWDVREKNKCVHSIEGANSNDQSDCWALSVPDEYSILSGHRDGYLRYYDIRTNAMLSSTQLSEGISSLVVSHNNVAMGTLTGEILTFKLDNDKFVDFPRLTSQTKSMMTVWGLKNINYPRNAFVSVGSDSAVTIHGWPNENNKLNTIARVNLESTPLIAVDTFASSPHNHSLLVTAGLDLKLRLFSLHENKT